MTRIYALTDSHQESRNLSLALSGIYQFEKDHHDKFLILDAGDIFKGIYDKNLSVNAYLKIKELLPQAQIFLTLGNNDFGFKKSDFEYLKDTIKKFKNLKKGTYYAILSGIWIVEINRYLCRLEKSVQYIKVRSWSERCALRDSD